MNENITLLVSSSDKYEDAWYPYFELIKRFWPEHPEKIALVTETKKYEDEELNVITYNYPESFTWSERLYRTLEQIETDFVFFSLEDFFLLDYVKQDRIDECVSWMQENPDIAVFKLHASSDDKLKAIEKYKEFYMADNTVSFRLETQSAIWNRKILMSYIDLSEDPWAFESKGTERIKDTDKIFLHKYDENITDMTNAIFPYFINQKFGYGIAWGHWLWKNKDWFEKNGIKGVKYSRLGVLSEKAVYRKVNHFYNKEKNLIEKIIYPLWRFVVKGKKVISNIKIFGLKKGLKKSWLQK